MRKTVQLLAMAALLLSLPVGCAEQEASQRESSGPGMSTKLAREDTIPRVRVDLAANFELDQDLEGKIVFTQNEDIWTINANGSNLTQLTDTTESEEDPAWSPDGKKIAFTRVFKPSGSASASSSPWASAGLLGPSSLFVMNADGYNETDLMGDHADDVLW